MSYYRREQALLAAHWSRANNRLPEDWPGYDCEPPTDGLGRITRRRKHGVESCAQYLAAKALFLSVDSDMEHLARFWVYSHVGQLNSSKAEARIQYTIDRLVDILSWARPTREKSKLKMVGG